MSSAWESSLAKISVLGTSRAAGEDAALVEGLEQVVAEGADDGADLVEGHDVAVELVGVVDDVLVELLQPGRAGLPVAELGDQPGFDGRAVFGDLGADPVDVEVDVDPVGDGLRRGRTRRPGSG